MKQPLALVSLLSLVASCAPEAKKSTEAENAAVKSVVPANVAPSEDVITTPMQRDLDRICHGEALSGALDLPAGDRAMHTGAWLANNIESQEARDLSVALTRLDASARVTRMRKELEAVGLSDCAILRTWRAK